MPCICQILSEAGVHRGEKDGQSVTHVVSCSSGGSRKKQTNNYDNFNFQKSYRGNNWGRGAVS